MNTGKKSRLSVRTMDPMINKASKTGMDRVMNKYDTHERYIIEQEPDWAESLTCGVCTKENKYKVR